MTFVLLGAAHDDTVGEAPRVEDGADILRQSVDWLRHFAQLVVENWPKKTSIDVGTILRMQTFIRLKELS